MTTSDNEKIPPETLAGMWKILDRLHDLPGIGTEWPPSTATMTAAVDLLNTELEIADNHGAWLRRIRHGVKRRGWEWNTENMNRYLSLRVVGE